MSSVLTSDAKGELHLPAALLPFAKPHAEYVIDQSAGALIISASQPGHEPSDNRTPTERLAAFKRWVDGLPRGGPGLSDWAVSRDSIYD